MNIVLTGMPGSGKTTVSEALGKLFGMNVVDTDEIITKNYGNITEIFKKYGEEYFRDLETQTVENVSKMQNIVVSTGGGCFLRQKNAELFKKSGKIVFLKADIETLAMRLEGDDTRPLLKGGLRQRLSSLISQRQHIYEEYADITVDTDNLTPEEIANNIERLMRSL